MPAIDRRAVVLGAATAGLGFFSTRSAASSGKRPAARFGHITDVHITDASDAPRGVAALFDHMFADKATAPQFVVNSGDAVMGIDGGVSGERAAALVKLWQDGTKGLGVPVLSCLGNHDYWGGKAPTAEIPAEMKHEKLMTKVLGMPHRWHSADRGGWHFIFLDSMCDWTNGYGYLTKEHFDWLKDDLKHTPKETPVCVVSHLPIVSVTSSLYGDSCKKGNANSLPGVWQHSDCWAISEVFRRHPNVRLCLSGHMHTQDRCEYRGVWYVCGGAGSGAWWAGSEYGFPPCYGSVSLYPDGGFDYEFVDYGWKARGWKGKQLPT